MKTAALQQARERLERARNAFSNMQTTDKFPDLEKNWSAFLSSAGAIYSKLEQGSKGCGTSEGWFGRKKHDRKSDELLSYLHHARNSDEHGIDGTSLQMHKIKIIKDVQGLKVEVKDGASVVVPMNPEGVIETVRYIAAKQVIDSRYGDQFMPPRSHLGKALGSADIKDPGNILEIAALGLAYLESLIAEAAKLPQHS